MGKVKSAVITSLLLAAVLVLALFATISCNVGNGVKRYNSFISNIVFGSELTGDDYTVLYPEGVISAFDYNLVVGGDNSEEKNDYQKKYIECGGIYVDRDKLGDNEQAFKESVLKDAKILSERFGERGYSSYSVSVEDDYSIKVTVPTNFTYAAYKSHDETKRSAALTEIDHSVRFLTLEGKVDLRASETATSSLIGVREDFESYFSGAGMYAMGGTYAVTLTLTDNGFDSLNKVLTANSGSEDGSGSNNNAFIFVGETSLGLQLKLGEALTEKTLMFQAEKAYAQDYSIILKSVLNGNKLNNVYNDKVESSETKLMPVSPAFGESAAIYLFAVVLIVLAVAIVLSIVKYKKLGLVNSLMAVIYALVMVCALMLTGVQLTIAGAFIAVLGLALLMFTNFYVFEKIRKETQAGRTIQASVKLGYKKTVASILDLHILLLIAATVMALVGVGELAAVGLIFLFAVAVSYMLYWFTRLMWFVISSMAQDKFAFCGYSREVYDNED